MSRPRSDYKICEFCGASLDVGERCDCDRIDLFADMRGLKIDREREDGETVYVIRDKKTGRFVGESTDVDYLMKYLTTGRVGA